MDRGFQVDLGYRDSRGVSGAFSSSPKSQVIKQPWGPFTKCEYKVDRNNEQLLQKLKFVNINSESVCLDLLLFKPLQEEINALTQKIKAICTQKQFSLLACYLSLVQQSEGFVYHDEIHDKHGFLINQNGLQLQDVQAAGGSLESYLEFRNLVQSCAQIVSNSNPKVKRKSENDNSSTAKLSRNDQILADEKIELERKEGLEHNYRRSYIGISSIALKNISVHPDLMHSIVKEKVPEIMENMKSRYDPSLSILVVCPVDPDNSLASLEPRDIKNEKFYVVTVATNF